MKRKKRTSSLKSSPENLPPEKSLESSSQQLVKEETCFYLPDECWDSIFRYIINDRRWCLKSLSFVSKQFLSITNGLIFSLSVKEANRHFLPRLFKRFTNINTIDLTHFCNEHNLDYLLTQISTFPLKLTLLKLPIRRFPADGLQTFSQNITTLTSLTCSYNFLHNYDLLLIADCFPLLKHLDLTGTYFLNDVAELSLFVADLVSINLSCSRLTASALFSIVRKCPSLSEIKMRCFTIGSESVWHSDSLVEFGVYPQLKSLYLGYNSWLSDESIIMFASIFPNLQHLDLPWCTHITEGICQVLRRCCKLRHLNLTGCLGVKLLGINFVIHQLEVLNLSYTKVDDETLYVISKNCCGLLKLLLKRCHNITEKGVKHVAENCTLLREIHLKQILLSDKNKELFSRRGVKISIEN